MKWTDFLQISRVRAVEEADARDELWDAATLRSVTLDAKDPAARAAQLIEKSRMPDLERTLRVPVMPGWVVVVAAAVAFITGWWFAALGQEREINLLALPLIAILLWNAAVLLLSLFHGVGKANGGKASAALEKMLDRFSPADTAGDVAKSPTAIRARFRALAWPVNLRRAAFGFRAWLHLGAALLAVGSVAGMYARGWSKEYRAVWESTLLGESGARTFLGALFTPASRVTGIGIPLDEIPQMHQGAESAAALPGAALPWIHLYAATLGLFVIAPRIIFALLERSRASRLPGQELRSTGWREYLSGLSPAAEGDGATIEIIAHALSLDEAARERWRRLARTRWRDADGVNCRVVAPGTEPDFLRDWNPVAPRILLVFNLATTPEVEVHRALAEGILAKLRQARPSTVLVLGLDDAELKKRWSGFADAAAKLVTRVESWREVMRGVAADWL